MSVPDWDALPWWQQRLYAEGLAEELSAGEQTGQQVDLADLGVTVRQADPPTP